MLEQLNAAIAMVVVLLALSLPVTTRRAKRRQRRHAVVRRQVCKACPGQPVSWVTIQTERTHVSSCEGAPGVHLPVSGYVGCQILARCGV
jgi:hypothetical protein